MSVCENTHGPDAQSILPNLAETDLSIETERQVAQQFIGQVQWQMILIGVGQCLLWLVTAVAVVSGTIPLWLGFAVALICALMAYLPSHEAQHGNLSGRKKGYRWVDPLVGQLSLLPLGASYDLLRATHMKHHAYTNDPLLDVDAWAHGDHWLQPALNVHRKGISKDTLARHMERDPAFKQAIQRGLPVAQGFKLLQLILVVFYPLEVLLLWWLPARLALSYLAVFFSWMPHRAGAGQSMLPSGRYRDTQFWRNRLPRYLVQSMQTHVVHHMYPGIPHWREPAAIERLRPFMQARGIPGSQQIPEQVRCNALTAD